MEVITSNAKETKEFGKTFASSLNGGEVIALVGDLGSGKTTFVQGLAEGLNISSRIISPTFILMRTYSANKQRIDTLYHLDLYRLESGIECEMDNLGITGMWDESNAVTLVEWADKGRSAFPANTIWINFEHDGDDKRKISIQ